MTFSTLLIANRGEIARRIIRGAHSMGIRCVCVYVDADAHSPYVIEADEAVHLTSGYLDADAVIEAARRSGAQAVHPGYGYLSENATFAQRVQDAGLVWVGPSPEVIATMGDKLAAKKLAVQSGVAVLASSENPSDDDAVGYPLMVKAVAGGGGKGMRIVTDPSQLDEALSGARREALSGFGDERVFIEHYIARSRHIEVQILGDHFGNLVHLGERECSIQRRHQKLIEESPSPVVDPAMREAMGAAALTLARAIGYQSAGTVEFLVDDESRDFFFLEVNTRLQVEHPVTEEVTGIDLVREQLRIAAGAPLGYGQSDVQFNGWAIEARLCAEDPVAGFLPATGTIVAFEMAPAPEVRLESGVAAGSVVSVSFDPMLAKVIAHAPTRGEAAAKLALALERMHFGGVVTNRDFLAATLRHEDFLTGETTTAFIDQSEPARSLELSDVELSFAAAAGALWLQGANRAAAPVLSNVPSGWRNARLPRQLVLLRVGADTLEVHYRSRRDGSFDIGDGSVGRIHAWSTRSIDLELDQMRAHVRVTRSADTLLVQSRRGTITFQLTPRFVAPGVDAPRGGLNAPMPGSIIDVRVTSGQSVSAGETLMVMEAMKMEHVISAPAMGIVGEVFVVAGQQVENGAVLLTLDVLGSDGD
jgi:propionyl-CoA carboxylase alpha chain